MDINDAYVKLYDDKNFEDRCLTIKYPTNISNMHDVSSDDGKEGFNDKVSSVKFWIPVGHKFTLYDDHDYKDSPYPLNGTGQVVEIPDLGSFNDKCSSGKWD